MSEDEGCVPEETAPVVPGGDADNSRGQSEGAQAAERRPRNKMMKRPDPERVAPPPAKGGLSLSQTLVSLLVHLVFSTKNRADFITPDIEPDLFAYLSGTLNNHESRCLAAGGTANHVTYSSRCPRTSP